MLLLAQYTEENGIGLGKIFDKVKINVEDYSDIIKKIKGTSLGDVLDGDKISVEKLSKAIDTSDSVIIGYAQTLKDTNGNIDLTTASTEGLSAYLKKSGQMFNFAAIKATLLNTALNAGIFLVASLAIQALVKGIDNLIHSAEHCKERVDELMSSYQSALDKANNNAKTIEEIADKYEKLSKGVNNLGENVSLTTDEYIEYNKIVNQIADMFPSMVQGYTDEGNAILSLKGNVEELRDAYKEAQQEAYNMLIVSGKDSDGNDILKHANNIITGSTLGAHNWGNIEKIKYLDKLINATESVDNMLSLWNESLNSAYYEWFEDFAGVGGTANISKLTEEDLAGIRNNARVFIQQYQAEIDSALKNVQTLANAYLMTNEDYALLDEQSRNAASIIINSINENIASGFEDKTDVGSYVANIINTLKDNPDIRASLVGLLTEDLSELSPTQAKDVVDQYITRITEVLHEDELELKIRLGFEDVDTIARNYNAVMKNAAAKFTGTDLSGFTRDIFRDKSIPDSDEYSTFEQEMKTLEDFAEENSINTQDEIVFWNKCIEESETREQAMEKYLSSPFIIGEETPTPSISDTITQLNSQLKPAFDSLKSAYQDIFIDDDQITLENVDISMLDSMKSKLDDLNAIDGISIDYSSFENLARVLTDTSSTIDDVKTAFNLLATDIVTGLNPALSDCSGENYRLVQSLLESTGITNAEAVMISSLGYTYEDYAAAKKECADAGIDLTDKTEQEIEKLTLEQIAAGTCGQALALLQLKKALCNETALNPGSDINRLYQLAKAANIATESISMLAGLNAAYEKESAAGHTLAALDIANRMAEVKADVEKQFSEIGNVEVDFSTKYDKGASSAAVKQAETDYKNLLDKETTLLEKQLAANVITFKEYTDKRKQIIEEYYRDGKIAAEEYYDALEDMYNDQLSLYDRAVNAVTNSIDDEIDRLEDQKEAIEKSYQVKIDAIQEEIDVLNKANNARQKQIDLEKAQYEAERARNQRVNKVNYMPLSAVMRSAKSNYIG